MPSWTGDDPTNFWRAGDRYERANGAVYRETEISLPSELTQEQQIELAEELTRGLAGPKPYQLAIHSTPSALERVMNTHMHLMRSDRVPDGIPRTESEFFRRANSKRPEAGGAKKESGGKNQFEMRSQIREQRRRTATIINNALEKHGHDERVDHRSLKEREIDRVPERYLGPAHVRRMTSESKQDYIAKRRLQRSIPAL